MVKHPFLKPFKNERPTLYADRVGKLYSSSVSDSYRKRFGQYLTPIEVADFMANLVYKKNNSVRILDPGTGTGILSCALCEALINKPRTPNEIYLLAYETDSNLTPLTEVCLEYLKKCLNEKKVRFSYEIKKDDFVLVNACALDDTPSLFPKIIGAGDAYDMVIANPPYFKIPKNDPRAEIAASVVHGQPNIYALFLAVSAALLKMSGELVFITPRSYAAGPYFRLFREKFFSMIKPEIIHLFGSRREAFDRDSILQENVILKARRKRVENKNPDSSFVLVSFSKGVKDLKESKKRKMPLSEIIDLESYDKILHIPVSSEEEKIIKLVNSWKGSLNKYGMQISTGPIVPFRANNLIDERGSVPESHAPLLWMQNVQAMMVKWPLKVRNKKQYIRICKNSNPLLLADRNYVVLRRFSAKEEKRRLTAAPLLAGQLSSNSIGLENHLNYIYRPKGELSEEEVFGLSALFNSEILDRYFRIFNGNTQVSATEIRNIPLPSLGMIKEIGHRLIRGQGSNGAYEKLIFDILRLRLKRKLND